MSQQREAVRRPEGRRGPAAPGAVPPAPWHTLETDETFRHLGTHAAGLSAAEADERLERHGPNEIVEKARKTPLRMLLEQFSDFMILVLIAAAVISGVIGEASDTVAIVVIVLLNAALGFSQEYRAERAIAALKRMAAASATVSRNGATATVPAAELVPGDVVHLEAGRVVPADLRIVEAARLTVDEAALTGESVPAGKHANPIREEDVPLGDRHNMLYKGTSVTYGRARAVVIGTGMDTELGRIAAMIQAEGEGKTPLQRRLAVFGRKLAYAVLAICAVVFGAGLLRGEPPVRMFLVAVSLAVAAIPEALPAVVTIALALGARRMVAQNALVRKLPAVETLGSVTYVCTDKTGTLTLNRMTVEELWVDGRLLPADRGALPAAAGSPVRAFLAALALSNDALPGAGGEVAGDPTETALYAAALERGFDKQALEEDLPRIAELPFDSERKLMTTFHGVSVAGGEAAGLPAGVVSFTKGAIETILDRAQGMLASTGVIPLDREAVLRESDRIAADGLRVLGIGMRSWEVVPPEGDRAQAEEDLVLVGLVGMLDPPREEAREAVGLCRTAGITPVMITGDHPLTARTIARRVGILDADDPAAVLTGRELDALADGDFAARVEGIRVYARVAPEQKLRIVQALQDRGHFVAMTGDGVNDAPALKRADIGVAMGITGTDVAKEASSMILLDDNFATIVKAVREGRKIYDNIRKFVKYLLTTNSGEIWTLFLAPFLGLPIPLLPIHILWINLVTDGLPALALSLEPAEPDIMARPPRSPQESIFAHGLGVHAVWVGLLMGGVVLGLQAWAIHVGDAHWQTMVFAVLCLLQLGHVLAIRSERRSLFSQGLFSNPWVFGAVAVTFLMQMATIYVPVLNPVFKTQPLSAGELAIVLGLSTAVFLAVELEKLVKRLADRPGSAGAR
jgi:Ca2+-transporting ATPase